MDINAAAVGQIVAIDNPHDQWQIIAVDKEEEKVLLEAHPNSAEAADRWEPVRDVYQV